MNGVNMISLGPDDGIAIINNYIMTGQKNGKTKLEDNFMKALKGDNKAKEKVDDEMAYVRSFLTCCNTLCCCCPCS